MKSALNLSYGGFVFRKIDRGLGLSQTRGHAVLHMRYGGREFKSASAFRARLDLINCKECAKLVRSGYSLFLTQNQVFMGLLSGDVGTACRRTTGKYSLVPVLIGRQGKESGACSPAGRVLPGWKAHRAAP